MKNKLIILVALVSVILSGCGKDYLNVTPTTSASDAYIFKNADNAEALMYGTYNQLTNRYGLGEWHECIYDVRIGDDVFEGQKGANCFNNSFSFTMIPGSKGVGSPYNAWLYFYRVIENANVALNATLPFKDQSELDDYVSEFKTIRACAYYHLAQTFCIAYTEKNGEGEGLPLYTKPYDGTKLARSPLKDVYALIEKDLTEAIAGSKVNIREKGARFGKVYAQGLMARVKMAEGDYDGALTYVEAALQNAPALSTGAELSTKGTARFIGETIFGVPEALDNYPGFNSCNSTFSYPDGYGNLFTSKGFIDTYPNDDVRRQWFKTDLFAYITDASLLSYFADYVGNLYHRKGQFAAAVAELKTLAANQTPLSASLFYPTNVNSKLEYRPTDYALNGKFRRLDGVPGTTVGTLGYEARNEMRTSELYLMKAECEARKAKPDEAAAREALYAIQHRSSASAKLSTASGSALIDQIMWERRRELIGEGFRLIDVKRLGLPMNRVFAGSTWTKYNTLPAYDPLFTLPIPADEINANPAITQNAGY